jgi:hypothetical protein
MISYLHFKPEAVFTWKRSNMIMGRVRPVSPYICCALALMIAAGPSAIAGCLTYTYTYTGDNYTTFWGDTSVGYPGSSLTTEDFTSATFTFAEPLPGNLNAVDESESPEFLGYSISDGVTTFGAYGGVLLEAPLFQLIFTTDEFGDILTGSFQGNAFGYGCTNCILVGNDFAYVSFGGQDPGEASGPGGTWNAAAIPTPEPDSFFLFGLGLALLSLRLLVQIKRENH